MDTNPYSSRTKNDLRLLAHALALDVGELSPYNRRGDIDKKLVDRLDQRSIISINDFNSFSYNDDSHLCDSMGNTIKFKLTPNSIYLFSFGENRRDDQLKKDDIFIVLQLK